MEKWNDIDELKKANPNMGVSVKESFFMDEIAVAEGSLSKKSRVPYKVLQYQAEQLYCMAGISDGRERRSRKDLRGL